MSLYQRFFAHTLAWGADAQHRLYGDRKRALFAGLEGTVVEIGPGTGVNLPYLPDGLRWIGLEPNPHMHDYIRDHLAGRDLEADLRTDPAQDTGLATNSVDAVLSTLVLCSVPDVAETLAELRRILRPGGQLVFIEHVAAASGRSGRQWPTDVDPTVRPGPCSGRPASPPSSLSASISACPRFPRTLRAPQRRRRALRV